VKSLPEYPSISQTLEWMREGLLLSEGEEYANKVSVERLLGFGLSFYVNLYKGLCISIDGMSFLHSIEPSLIPKTVEEFYETVTMQPKEDFYPFILKKDELLKYESESLGAAFLQSPDGPKWQIKRFVTLQGSRFPEVVLETLVTVFPDTSNHEFKARNMTGVYCVKSEIEALVKNFKKLYDAHNPKRRKPTPNKRIMDDRWEYDIPEDIKIIESEPNMEDRNDVNTPEKRQLVLRGWLIGAGYGLGHEFEDRKRLDVWNAMSKANAQLFPVREQVDSTINNFFNTAKLCSFKKGR